MHCTCFCILMMHFFFFCFQDLEDAKSVRGVPTFKYYKDKALLSEFAGANQDKLEQLITQNK
jgi:hypothetical protein